MKLWPFRLAVVIVAACDARADPPREQQAPLAVAPAATAPASNTEPAAAPKAAPPAPDAAASITARSSLIERFVAKDVLALTPDQAKARFADRFELRRERETVDGFGLTAGDAGQRVIIGYAPDGKGAFRVSVASLLFFVSSVQAPELQSAIADQLTKTLGKPRKPSASSETLYWKLGRRADLDLLDYKSTRPNEGERVIELRVYEPDGP